MRNATTSRLAVISAATVVASFLACSGDDGGVSSSDSGGSTSSTSGSGGDPEEYLENQLVREIMVSGAGDVMDQPAQDDSVTISGGSPNGTVRITESGLLTVSISFSAENANVVGAGIAFSENGPILNVPAPEMEGETEGTIEFSVQFPSGLCDDLGSICHSLRCYEYAITSEGLVSPVNFVDMTASCGQCSEPSCALFDPGCAAPCYDDNGDTLPEPEPFLEVPSADDLALGGEWLYFAAEPLSRALADGTGELEPILDDTGAEILDVREVVVVEDQLFVEIFLDGIFQMNQEGGVLTELGDLGELLYSDGEHAYTHDDGAFCSFNGTSVAPGVRRIDTSGEVTELASDLDCILALAFSDTDIYFIVEDENEERFLYSMPKDGSTPQAETLDVSEWTSLFHSEGYLIGAMGTSGHVRGLPSDVMATELTRDAGFDGSDGISVFLTEPGTAESCWVEARGGEPLVKHASFDIREVPTSVAVGEDYVYYIESDQLKRFAR